MAEKIQRAEPIIDILQNIGGNYWQIQIIDVAGNVVLIDEKHLEQCIHELAKAKHRIDNYKVHQLIETNP